MKIIRLVVFNEEFWNKGLIYSQNILPLKKLADNIGGKLELYSFTSIPMLIKHKSEIKSTRLQLKNMGIKLVNMPVLYYPTRYMLPYWYLLPYFYLNVIFYILKLNKNDLGKDVVYNLRSYPTSLAFYKFYKYHDKLIFDPRTDFIEEKTNAGYFKEGSFTVKFWNKITRNIILSFKETIVISDIFRDNLLKKYMITDSAKIEILYNPINYSAFDTPKIKHDGKNFLYTGSLGKWNKLSNYIGVYKAFYEKHPDSRFIICTNASADHVDNVLNDESNKSLRNSIEVHYKVPYEDLPKYYAMCDYGFQLMNQKDSRVGVKFVEYLASGIIPIVNENVQGAALLAKKYKLGVIIGKDDTPDDICRKIESAKTIDKASKSYNEFRYLTDLATISERIKEIYL